MSYQVQWTPESKRTFNPNIEYLIREWDTQVTHNFLDRVDEVLGLIKHNPLLFPAHRPADNIHKCIVDKRIIVYYRIVDEQNIDLLTFWNTFQNPDNLKL